MKKLLAILLFVSLSFAIHTNHIWVGNTSTAWGNQANWNPADEVPDATDTVIFDATANNECIVDENFNVLYFDMQSGFDENFSDGGFACTTGSHATFDAAGAAQGCTLSGDWYAINDGNITFDAGPTYSISATTCDIYLQGTGNLQNNTGGFIGFHQITGAAAGKVTTNDGSAADTRTMRWILGAGEWANAQQFQVKLTEADALTFNDSSSITGAGLIIINIDAGVTLDIPIFNGSGHPGITRLDFGATAVGAMSMSGAFNNGGVTWIRKVTTGAKTFTTNNNDFTSAGDLIVGNNNVTNDLTLNCGSSTFDLGADFETTTYNTGTTIINAQTLTGTVAGNLSIGTNCTWNDGTELITIDGAGAQALTFAGELFYDLDVDKSSGAATAQDAIRCNTLTITAGGFDQNAQPITSADDQTFGGAGTITLDAPDTITGDADFTLSAGPTYGVSGLTIALEGTGTFNQNTGGHLTFASLTCAAAGKVTTLASSPNKDIRPNLLTIGAGQLVVSTKAQVMAGSANPLVTNVAHSITGTSIFVVRTNGKPLINIPQINAAGHTGDISVFNGGAAATIDIAGSITSGRDIWLSKQLNAATTINVNGNDLTPAGDLEIGNNNATAALTVNFGTSSAIDIGSDLLTTQWNVGATTINPGNASIKIAEDLTLGTNTNWVPTSDTLELDGAAGQVLTLNTFDTLGAIIINKASGTASTASNLACLYFAIEAGEWDISADTVTCLGDALTASGVTFTGDAASIIYFTKICPTITKTGVTWPTYEVLFPCILSRSLRLENRFWLGL